MLACVQTGCLIVQMVCTIVQRWSVALKWGVPNLQVEYPPVLKRGLFLAVRAVHVS